MVERSERQFLGKTTYALDLDAVEQNKDEHAERQTEGAVRVRSRDDLEVRQPQQGGQTRDVVDRNPFQAVHQEHPDEDGQRQRCYQGVAAMKGVLDYAFNELNAHFNEVLQTPRNT